MRKKRFDSVWDAIEDDPVKREIYELRSDLIHVITEHIKANNLKQREVAELLGISQPRVSTLMYFGTSPEFWLNLQTSYDLEEASKDIHLANITGERPFTSC